MPDYEKIRFEPIPPPPNKYMKRKPWSVDVNNYNEDLEDEQHKTTIRDFIDVCEKLNPRDRLNVTELFRVFMSSRSGVGKKVDISKLKRKSNNSSSFMNEENENRVGELSF